MKRFFFIVLLSLAASFRLSAAEGDSLRILWIGNSYTYFHDLPQIVKDIASSQRMRLRRTRAPSVC